jgi:hypothetical protein
MTNDLDNLKIVKPRSGKRKCAKASPAKKMEEQGSVPKRCKTSATRIPKMPLAISATKKSETVSTQSKSKQKTDKMQETKNVRNISLESKPVYLTRKNSATNTTQVMKELKSPLRNNKNGKKCDSKPIQKKSPDEVVADVKTSDFRRVTRSMK